MKFFATAAQGTEGLLCEELGSLGLERVKIRRGGVEFSGRWEDAWRACLWSRIAVRILHPVAEFHCRGADDLYAGARSVDWAEHLSPKTTLAVSAVGAAPGLDNTMFVAQRVKDAVVDRLRDELGARPSVDRDDPDVALFARLGGGRATILLDLAGDSLHRRGYRADGARAPLKETLAAALVRASGWDRVRPFLDPMCGSGTVAIEADHLARNVAPGLGRSRFGFERWASFDEGRKKRWALLRQQARSRALDEGPEVSASDHDPKMVELARGNVQRARAHVRVSHARVADLSAGSPPGIIVSNPPHGERLVADPELYAALERLTRELSGHRFAFLLGPNTPFRAPRSARLVKVNNGALKCRFAVFDGGLLPEPRGRGIDRG